MQSEFECVPWDGGKQTALISITDETTHELQSSTTLVLPTCSDMPPPPVLTTYLGASLLFSTHVPRPPLP